MKIIKIFFVLVFSIYSLSVLAQSSAGITSDETTNHVDVDVSTSAGRIEELPFQLQFRGGAYASDENLGGADGQTYGARLDVSVGTNLQLEGDNWTRSEYNRAYHYSRNGDEDRYNSGFTLTPEARIIIDIADQGGAAQVTRLNIDTRLVSLFRLRGGYDYFYDQDGQARPAATFELRALQIGFRHRQIRALGWNENMITLNPAAISVHGTFTTSGDRSNAGVNGGQFDLGFRLAPEVKFGETSVYQINNRDEVVTTNRNVGFGVQAQLITGFQVADIIRIANQLDYDGSILVTSNNEPFAYLQRFGETVSVDFVNVGDTSLDLGAYFTYEIERATLRDSIREHNDRLLSTRGREALHWGLQGRF